VTVLGPGSGRGKRDHGLLARARNRVGKYAGLGRPFHGATVGRSDARPSTHARPGFLGSGLGHRSSEVGEGLFGPGSSAGPLGPRFWSRRPGSPGHRVGGASGERDRPHSVNSGPVDREQHPALVGPVPDRRCGRGQRKASQSGAAPAARPGRGGGVGAGRPTGYAAGARTTPWAPGLAYQDRGELGGNGSRGSAMYAAAMTPWGVSGRKSNPPPGLTSEGILGWRRETVVRIDESAVGKPAGLRWRGASPPHHRASTLENITFERSKG